MRTRAWYDRLRAVLTGPGPVGRAVLLSIACVLTPGIARGQLFDFENAPYRSALPIDVTVGDLTAHFSATGQGFSIQAANTMGFTPAGFSGLCIYPSSVFAADLIIDFSTPVTDFSILYAPQELACDDSAIMRVTAYQDATLRGTATTTAPVPGTWPSGTLAYSDPLGFNHVVIHYDQRPACTDYGPIFMADNMNVTVMTTSVPWIDPSSKRILVTPNPFRGATSIRFTLPLSGKLAVSIQDLAGRTVRSLAEEGMAQSGPHRFEWDGTDNSGNRVESGVYLCRVITGMGVRSTRVIVRH